MLSKRVLTTMGVAVLLGAAAFTLDVDIRVKESNAAAATPPTAVRSPTRAIPESDLDVYYPGSEDLKPDEMRYAVKQIAPPTAVHCISLAFPTSWSLA